MQDLHPPLVASKAAEGEASGEDLRPLPELLCLRKVPKEGVPGLANKAQALLFQGLGQGLEGSLGQSVGLTSKAEAFDSPGTPVRCLPDLELTAVAEPDLLSPPPAKSAERRGPELGRNQWIRLHPLHFVLPRRAPEVVCRADVRPEGRQNRHPVKGHGLRERLPGLREKLGEGGAQVVSPRAALRPVLFHAPDGAEGPPARSGAGIKLAMLTP